MLPETNGSGSIKGTPAANMKALSKELPGLIKLSKIIHDKPLKGIHLLKPGNSEPFEEEWICSFLGNLGLPFVPANIFDEEATSAVFPVQALKDPEFAVKLKKMLDKGTPVVLTDGLSKRLSSHPDILNNNNLSILPAQGNPRGLLKMTREELKPLRDKLLAPMSMKFDAPDKVELYLFGDNYFVVENINDETIDITLDFPKLSDVTKTLVLPEEGATSEIVKNGNSLKIKLSGRTLLLVEYK